MNEHDATAERESRTGLAEVSHERDPLPETSRASWPCHPDEPLPPVLLRTKDELELDVKLDPLDLLPLVELFDEDPVVAMVRPESPLLPAEFEKPGPERELVGARNVPAPLDEPLASLCVHTPSARYVFVTGTWIATVRTTPSMRSSE